MKKPKSGHKRKGDKRKDKKKGIDQRIEEEEERRRVKTREARSKKWEIKLMNVEREE